MMKFGQLIEYNKIFFLKNDAWNVAEKLVPDPILKIRIEHISQSTNSLKFSTFCFRCISKLRATKICRSQGFEKQKEVWN